jgi:branched-chain amino acid transport system substrate-binding protein
MWSALQQQGVFSSTTVTTGLAERATWQSYGPAAGSIKFLSHYVWDGPRNPVNDWLVAKMKQNSQRPDLFTPDGFNAGLMIVRALSKGGGDDAEKMISSLEGWEFTGPKGPSYIRPQDHALLQPMFQVSLVKGKNGTFTDKVLKMISPGLVQPPIQAFK